MGNLVETGQVISNKKMFNTIFYMHISNKKMFTDNTILYMHIG